MNTPSSSRKPALRIVTATGLAAVLLLAACDKTTNPPEPVDTITRAQLIAQGEVEFGSCSGCHGTGGEGQFPHTPPLLHSDFLMAERLRPIRIMLLGIPNAVDTATTITVNGVEYVDQSMPAIGSAFSDTTLAALLTYLRVRLNDSSSVNCNAQGECDLVPRAGVATDSVTPEEAAGVRALLVSGGHLE